MDRPMPLIEQVTHITLTPPLRSQSNACEAANLERHGINSGETDRRHLRQQSGLHTYYAGDRVIG